VGEREGMVISLRDRRASVCLIVLVLVRKKMKMSDVL